MPTTNNHNFKPLKRKGFYEILSNPRSTFVTPPGTGFLPRETAQHHQNHIVRLVRCALRDAGIKTSEVQKYIQKTLLGGVILEEMLPSLNVGHAFCGVLWLLATSLTRSYWG